MLLNANANFGRKKKKKKMRAVVLGGVLLCIVVVRYLWWQDDDDVHLMVWLTGMSYWTLAVPALLIVFLRAKWRTAENESKSESVGEDKVRSQTIVKDRSRAIIKRSHEDSASSSAAASSSLGYCDHILNFSRANCKSENGDVSAETWQRVAATKRFIQKFYVDLFIYRHRRGLRYLEIYQQSVADEDEEEEDDDDDDDETVSKERELLLYSTRESDYLRIRRRNKHAKHGYTLLSELGSGGYGTIYLAKSRSFDVFAVKKMKKAHFLLKNAVERARLERDMMAAMQENEWVVGFVESFTDEENLYVVMEFLPGGDFASLLHNVGQLADDAVRFYIGEMVMALDSLHAKHYIHRDVKPANLLVDGAGHLKLIDFGLSKDGAAQAMQTWRGTLDRWNEPSGRATLIERLAPVHCSSTGSSSTLSSSAAAPSEPLPAPNAAAAAAAAAAAEWFSADLAARRTLKESLRDPIDVAHSSIVGSPEYIAYEVLLQQDYNEKVDYWAVGIMLFEIFVGITPFWDQTVDACFARIMAYGEGYGSLVNPIGADGRPMIPSLAFDLIQRLLEPVPSKRLGADGIKQHPFFAGVDWGTLRSSAPPFVPDIADFADTSYFRGATPSTAAAAASSQVVGTDSLIAVVEREWQAQLELSQMDESQERFKGFTLRPSQFSASPPLSLLKRRRRPRRRRNNATHKQTDE
jgi:serine/threonine protein kinase